MTMKGTNNIEQGFQNDGQHQANIHVDICCISRAQLSIVLSAEYFQLDDSAYFSGSIQFICKITYLLKTLGPHDPQPGLSSSPRPLCFSVAAIGGLIYDIILNICGGDWIPYYYESLM